MIGGVIIGLAGIGLFSGSLIARIVAVLLAAASMVWNFYSVPYYPVGRF